MKRVIKKINARRASITLVVALLKRDLLIFSRNYRDYFINTCIWVVLEVGIFAYFMPYFGLQVNFGTFVLASIVASLGLFESMHSAEGFVIDIEGERQITYDLTLPLSARAVFVQRALLYTIRSMLMGIFVIPVGKLVFWNKIDLTNFSLFKFSVTFVFTSIMYGFLTLWVVSFIHDVDDTRDVWIRLIMPFWALGGYQFSWQSISAVSQWLGYAVLLNPVIYVTESFRAAIMGQEGMLNFGFCILMLVLFSFFFAWRGIHLLTKRLDCI